MPTATNASYDVSIFVYDESIEDRVDELLAPSTNVANWGHGRFPSEPEEAFSVGIQQVTYPNWINVNKYSNFGIEDDLQFHWRSAKKLSTQVIPTFEMGRYYSIDINGYEAIQSRATVQEVWNSTSVVETSENANRHVCTSPPSLEYPIQARIYQGDKVFRHYEDVSILNSYFSSETSQIDIYAAGPHIDWTAVDTSVKEIAVDVYLSNGSEIVCNQDPSYFVGPEYASTVASLLDLTAALEDLSGGTQYFTSYYHPIDTDNLNLYIETTDRTAIIELVQTDTISATNHYTVTDPWRGEIFYGSGLEESTQKMYASYNAVPSIEYIPEDVASEDVYVEPSDIDMRRLTMDDDSYNIVIGTQNQITTINIKPELSEISSGTWATAYYGGNITPITIEALDVNNEPVSGAPISLSLSTSEYGYLSGYSPGTIYTDPNGQYKLYHVSPYLNDNLGAKVTAPNVTAGYIDLPTDRRVYKTSTDDVSHVYVYHVMKDDPLVGKGGADTSIGEIAWDTSVQNGRKRIVHVWDSTAIHPILETVGAFIPLHPLQITETNSRDRLDFSVNPITVPDPSTATDTMIGAYWVLYNRSLQLTASVSDVNYGTASDVAEVVMGLSSDAVGNHIYNGSTYPYGWRLPSAAGDVASKLGGALFLCINPVSGSYEILFEGASLSSTASYPFAVMDCSFYVN